MIRLGVTGTDTGVGKTVVTCAIAAALQARGLDVAAMKPIETGVDFNDIARDGARISRAAKSKRRLSVTAPLVFPLPVSPLNASRAAARPIDLAQLDAAMADSERNADVLLVEGAGGLLVPLTPTISFAELFHRWSLEIIIVAVNRLGVINHTLLTAQAALSASLPVRAIVLNSAPPSAAEDASVSGNANQLRELLVSRFPIPASVIQLPWLSDVGDLHALADCAERSGLAEIVVAATN